LHHFDPYNPSAYHSNKELYFSSGEDRGNQNLSFILMICGDKNKDGDGDKLSSHFISSHI
jgi:hypothetical protein